MTNHQKIENIIAFLAIVFGEDNELWHKVMELNPHYLIEKFERYILSTRVEYPWGMHPSLRDYRFQSYVDKWEFDLKENNE